MKCSASRLRRTFANHQRAGECRKHHGDGKQHYPNSSRRRGRRIIDFYVQIAVRRNQIPPSAISGASLRQASACRFVGGSGNVVAMTANFLSDASTNLRDPDDYFSSRRGCHLLRRSLHHVIASRALHAILIRIVINHRDACRRNCRTAAGKWACSIPAKCPSQGFSGAGFPQNRLWIRL